MTEEQVTRRIVQWLGDRNFRIVAFDYPGSGTGRRLHPNVAFRRTKNNGIIIPDIITSFGGHLVFFENKTWYCEGDLGNLLLLRDSGRYSESVQRVIAESGSGNVLVGMALSDTAVNRAKLLAVRAQLDFGMVVAPNGDVDVTYSRTPLFT